jgi:hypothetical protein
LSPAGDAAARFAALELHPEAARALAAGPASTGRGARAAAGLLGLAVFLVLGTLVTVALMLFFPPLGVASLVLVLLGALAIVRGVVRTLRAPDLPEIRGLALVADEQTSFSGGAGDRAVTTRRSLTLEFRDGTRRVLLLGDELEAPPAPGDMGVASLRGDRLVGFTRIEP